MRLVGIVGGVGAEGEVRCRCQVGVGRAWSDHSRGPNFLGPPACIALVEFWMVYGRHVVISLVEQIGW